MIYSEIVIFMLKESNNSINKIELIMCLIILIIKYFQH